MSYIKLEHRVLNDPRVLDLSPPAFTVHLYALDYANEQASDGVIPFKVAHRMMCQLDPAEIADAFKELVLAGLWEVVDDSYVCPEFLAYGIEADEQHTTRAKWAQDKRRRRLHNIGNHALCLAASCSAKKAQGSNSTDGVDSDPLKGGRLDPTRPDQTPKGSGSGRPGQTRSADAGAPPGLAVDISLTRAKYGHTEVLIQPPADEFSRARFAVVARYLLERVLVRSAHDLWERHGCEQDEGCRVGIAEDASLVYLIVPETVDEQWADVLCSWFSGPGRAAA